MTGNKQVKIRDDFLSITGDSELRRFLANYGFSEISAAPRWNLGEFESLNAGTIAYRVGYRWYDPSQAFSIQRDIHKAELWSIDDAGRQSILGEISFDEAA